MDRRTHVLSPVLATLAIASMLPPAAVPGLRGYRKTTDETPKSKRARKLAKANRRRNASRRRSGNG